jgi:hypothetical protein
MRSLITGVLLTCVSLLAAACSGSSGSPAAAGASSAPEASAPVSSPGPGSPGPASSSPAAPVSPAQASTPLPVVSVAGAWSGYGPCPDLAVRLGLSQAVGSVTYQVIVFTNRSGRTCFLDGVPGINLGGGTPVAPIGLPATQASSAKAKRIAIQPGAAANALLQITNARSYSTAACGPVPARYLIVYLPNAATPGRVPYRTTACSRAVQMMQVSAVSRGTGG